MHVLQRAKNILLRPRQQWPVIEQEVTTPVQLYRRYVMVLAAIGPLAWLIGWSAVGMTVPSSGTMRMSLFTSIPYTIAFYGIMLGWVHLNSWIINFLAPAFGGVPNRRQALKVTAYAATAAFVGGIFNLIPAIGALAFITGGYSLYLIYTALPILMKVPVDRTLACTMAIVLAGILTACVLGVPIGLVSSLIAPSIRGFTGEASFENGGAKKLGENAQSYADRILQGER